MVGRNGTSIGRTRKVTTRCDQMNGESHYLEREYLFPPDFDRTSMMIITRYGATGILLDLRYMQQSAYRKESSVAVRESFES